MVSLVADVGATNARFQICDANGWIGAPLVVPTAGFSAQEALYDHVVAQMKVEKFERSLLAVAGPLDKDEAVTVTNTGLRFTRAGAEQALGCKARLVNDFYAQAAFVPFAAEREQLGGSTDSDGVKAVLGPGSGCGMATLVPVADSWRILSGEGGHTNLAPGSHLELELWGALAQRFDHISLETVLCGPGLVNLYRAMCVVWGSKPEELTAQQISSRGASMDDPVCHQTLETFFGLLGAAAGDLALTVGAVGGVYLGGGIVPQMLDFARTSPLRRRFEEKGPMRHYVAAIPLYIITASNPGLEGARVCLEQGI